MSLILTNGRTQNIDLSQSFNREMRYDTLSQLENLKPTEGEIKTKEENRDDWAFDVSQSRSSSIMQIDIRKQRQTLIVS